MQSSAILSHSLLDWNR